MSNTKNCFNCKHGSQVQYINEERKIVNYDNLARCDSIDNLNHLVDLNEGEPIMFPQYNGKAKNPQCKFFEVKNGTKQKTT